MSPKRWEPAAHRWVMLERLAVCGFIASLGFLAYQFVQVEAEFLRVMLP